MSDLRRAAERTLRWLDSETPTTVDAAYAEERAIAEALRDALAQQPEPVQEPVAKVELMTTGGNAGLATRIVEIEDHLRERLRPGQLLYTAPPQRKPLTDEEIETVWRQKPRWHAPPIGTTDIEFARAVERKVRGEE